MQNPKGEENETQISDHKHINYRNMIKVIQIGQFLQSANCLVKQKLSAHMQLTGCRPEAEISCTK